MKRLLSTSLLPALLIFTCGYTSCGSSGLSVREQPTSYSKMVYQIVGAQDDPQQNRKLQFPLALGVAQIGETAPPPELITALQSHRELIATVTEIPLPEDLFQSRSNDGITKEQAKPAVETATALRRLGKQIGVDCILIIGGTMDSRSQSTPLELLDLAIIPAFVVPSERVSVEAKAAGALFDVETGNALLLVNATSAGKKYAPSEYAEDAISNLSVAQRSILSSQLSEDLVKKLTQFQARQK